MTAIVVVSQPKHGCIHVATDAAMYHVGSGVVAFGNKVTSVPHWPGAVTCAGIGAATPLFAWSLAQDFATWDDMVLGADAVLPGMYAMFGLPGGSSVILAGISAKRGPEAYAFQTDDVLPPGTTREEAEASPYYAAPFKMVKLPDHIGTPVAPIEMVEAAGFEGFDVDGDVETVLWSMRKLIMMQRHMPLPGEIGGIGGFAEITTISEEGTTQRIVERWSDQIGDSFRPTPIDWAQWHRDNPRPGANVTPLKTIKTI